MNTRPLILVDENDRPLGTATREDAHQSPGALHRAFSVYIFRKDGQEILIQKRHADKLFGGLWANSCCSHPREGDDIHVIAARRLREELGFTCVLAPVATFVYQAEDPGHRGAEHEHVTVFRGDVDNVTVAVDPTEVAEWKWIPVKELQEDMTKQPDKYAPWFHIGLEKILSDERKLP